MRIKNLRGVIEVRLKEKLDSFNLETSKNNLIRKFLRNGRVRVKIINGTGSLDSKLMFKLKFFAGWPKFGRAGLHVRSFWKEMLTYKLILHITACMKTYLGLMNSNRFILIFYLQLSP